MNTASLNVTKALVCGAIAMILTAGLVGTIDNSVGTPRADQPALRAAAQALTSADADRAA
jgi:hypothetical protein